MEDERYCRVTLEHVKEFMTEKLLYEESTEKEKEKFQDQLEVIFNSLKGPTADYLVISLDKEEIEDGP